MRKPVVPSPASPSSTGPRILLVDDDPGVLFVIRARLRDDGFALMVASSAEQALEQIARDGMPDLAVIDIRLPGMGGVELGKRLRTHSHLPIILLSAVDEEQTVVESLEQFAQDYIRKPFFPRELAARIRRLLAQVQADRRTHFVIDDRLMVDLAQHEVIVDSAEISLTPTEAKLLGILLAEPGRTVPVPSLLSQIWANAAVAQSALRVNIYRLRQKIEVDPQSPRYLITRRGLGYAFVVEPD